MEIIVRQEDNQIHTSGYYFYKLITLHNDTISVKELTHPKSSEFWSKIPLNKTPYYLISNKTLYFIHGFNKYTEFDIAKKAFKDTFTDENGIYYLDSIKYLKPLGVFAAPYYSNLEMDKPIDLKVPVFYRHPILGFIQRNFNSMDTFWFLSGSFKDLHEYEKKLGWKNSSSL